MPACLHHIIPAARPLRVVWRAGIVLLVLMATHVARAQDFRVVTRVSQYLPDSQEWQPVSRSLTLFHAGKVYDKVEEVGEVVILEPQQSRFILLNGNNAGCAVRFEELHQFLKVAHSETLSYMSELRAHQDSDSQQAAQALKFQLNPSFEEDYDARSGRLRLTSPTFDYDVRTDKSDRPQVIDSYLTYADWAARMNHVLHPHSLYPASRLSLNEALRQHQRLPTLVSLRLAMPGETRLQAEHRYEWELQSFDKTDIRTWESLLQSPDLRWLDFREYQRELMNRLADRR